MANRFVHSPQFSRKTVKDFITSKIIFDFINVISSDVASLPRRESRYWMKRPLWYRPSREKWNISIRSAAIIHLACARASDHRARDCLEGRGGDASLAAVSRHVNTKKRLVTERGRGGKKRTRGERKTQYALSQVRVVVLSTFLKEERKVEDLATVSQTIERTWETERKHRIDRSKKIGVTRDWTRTSKCRREEGCLRRGRGEKRRTSASRPSWRPGVRPSGITTCRASATLLPPLIPA